MAPAKAIPFHTYTVGILADASTGGSGPPAKLIPAASIRALLRAGPCRTQCSIHHRPCRLPHRHPLLISALQMEEIRDTQLVQHKGPPEMPDRALSLDSATTKRAPGHHYLPELLSSSRKQMLGPPSSEPLSSVGSPSAPGGLGGRGVAGTGGSGAPHGARCPRQSLPAGHSDRICGRRSCRRPARGEKAFKGDA